MGYETTISNLQGERQKQNQENLSKQPQSKTKKKLTPQGGKEKDYN